MSKIDDVKTLILALLPDNTSGDISPQDARDAFDLVLNNLGNLDTQYLGAIIPTDAGITGVEEGATVLPLGNGTYSNFGGLVVDDELCVFVRETIWVKKVVTDYKVLGFRNKLQIYITDNGYITLEENTTSAILYFTMSASIAVREASAGSKTITISQLATELGVSLVTSPNGLPNCIEIPNAEDLVYSNTTGLFSIVGRGSVVLDMDVIVSNVAGSINKVKDTLLPQWVLTQASQTNKIQIYIGDDGRLITEEDSLNNILYFTTTGQTIVRASDIAGRNISISQLATEVGKPLVTSPNGLPECIQIPQAENLVFDVVTNLFSIVSRDDVSITMRTVVSDNGGLVTEIMPTLLPQWLKSTDFVDRDADVDSLYLRNSFTGFAGQSLEWIKNQLWIPDAGSTDHLVYADIRLIDDKGIDLGDTYTHNLGHLNNFSYNENTDKGLTGNHDGQLTTLAKTLIVPSVSAPPLDILEYAACVEIIWNDGITGLLGDITACQHDACWYDGSGDFGVISWYSDRDKYISFAKVQFGRGTNDLSGATYGYGSYTPVAAGEYNGTAEILQRYDNSEFEYFVTGTHVGDWVIQGMTFYNGKLYVGAGVGDSVFYEILLDEYNDDTGFNSTYRKTKIFNPGRDGEAEGVTVKNGVLYGGYGTNDVYIFPLSDTQSGSARIGDTVNFLFENFKTPNLQITPINNGGLIAADLYRDTISPTQFVVKSVANGSIGNYLFEWKSIID